MSLLQIFPVLAYAAAALVLIRSAGNNTTSASWTVVALLAAAFTAYSLLAVVEDGLIQFWINLWINHTSNFAGNQVWIDILISATLAFILMLPRARAQGMAILPWALAVATTASIALLIMMARLLWLEQTARDRQA